MKGIASISQPFSPKSIANTGIQASNKRMPDVSSTIEARVKRELNRLF